MNSTPLGYQFPLKIKTLSPVHIGGDETLSPLADYVIDSNNDVRFIDAEKFADAVLKSSSVDKYTKIVIENTNLNKSTVLKDFAWQTLKTSIAEFYTDTKIKSVGIDNPTLIDCCIKTNGLPYIPGSTLKGALRTCILYNWLASGNAESKRIIEGFLDDLYAVAGRTDFRTQKKVDEISGAYYKKVEEVLFGSLKQQERLPASCIQLTDSGTTGIESLAAYHLKRLNILTGESGTNIPIIKECIVPGCYFDAEFKLDFYYNKELHPIVRNLNKIENVFALINKYSLDVLEYEDALAKDKLVKINSLKQYYSHTAKRKEQIEHSNNTKGYLRLGFGKMQFYQTIAMALFKHLGSNEDIEEWLKYLSYSSGNLDKDEMPAIFPSTRTLTTIGQEPLGWVEIS